MPDIRMVYGPSHTAEDLELLKTKARAVKQEGRTGEWSDAVTIALYESGKDTPTTENKGAKAQRAAQASSLVSPSRTPRTPTKGPAKNFKEAFGRAQKIVAGM